jgi:hypothetical protein
MVWSNPPASKSYVSNSPGATYDNAVRAKCRLVLQWSGVGGARAFHVKQYGDGGD